MPKGPIKKVCVIGLGYIGLPTASIIASRGVDVIGVDTSQHVVDTINSGKIHIVEPDLDAVTAQAVQQGRLRAATKPEEADAFVIAVPTPLRDNSSDLAYVDAATQSIAPVLRRGDLVVLESTSPPGTTERITAHLAKARPDLQFPQNGSDTDCDILVAYCPERVLPGRVLTELYENDRVIGGLGEASSAKAMDLYRIFCKGELLVTSARTAEMCKLTENAFRDVNIAFANELSLVCDKLDINVWELIKLANHHPRVNILQPGPGVGGHCIAVDPWFIVEAAPNEARLIRTARAVNDSKPHFVADKIKAALARIPANDKPRTIAILGLAFKPDVDDLRESPALEITEAVAGWENVNLVVSEPNIDELPKSLAGRANVRLDASPHEAVRVSSIVVMLVNHRDYGVLALAEFNDKILIDTRGVWS